MAAQSPFKLLNAYELEDRDIFFGRDEETDTLEHIAHQSNLILVYGQSGTGKTSLIQCGLASRFAATDWFHIYIRREENINAALLRNLQNHQPDRSEEEDDLLELLSTIEPGEEVSATSGDTDSAIIEALKGIYGTYLRPIYLLFDQFEELFTLGEEEEQEQFYQNVAEILRQAPFCKLIFIMREEYIAMLNDFEHWVANLFDHRLRVELMSRKKINEVIVRTASEFDIALDHVDVPDRIIDNIDSDGHVQLPYLQVYLDRLWHVARARSDNGIVFDMPLLEETRIGDVLSHFLEERLDIFQKELGRRDDAIRFLKVFVTREATKEPRRWLDLVEALPSLQPERIKACLDFFIENRVVNPGGKDRFELAHDSLAAKIAFIEIDKRALPKLPASLATPDNPFAGYGSYTPEMARVFFGRGDKVEQLFNKIVNAPDAHITLLFGPTGSGKSSLINAGLIPRIRRYYDVFYQKISRAYVDRMEALHLSRESDSYSGEWSSYVLERLMQGNIDTDKPDLIILDQFEEFFIWANKSMLRAIIKDLKQLVEESKYRQILIALRSEHFAKILELDQSIPKLLDNRLRLDPVDDAEADLIIREIATHLNMQLQDEAVHEIIEKSKVDEVIDLGFVQMFMQQIHNANTP